MLVKCILLLFDFRASNGEILKYMKAHNITGKFRLLESLYMNKLMSIVSDFPEKKQTAGTIISKYISFLLSILTIINTLC